MASAHSGDNISRQRPKTLIKFADTITIIHTGTIIMEFDQLLESLFRWIHMFAGVAWIGLLYYFNFVQTEYFNEAEAPAKASAIDKLVPRAKQRFRYGALFTFLSGLALAGYLGGAVNFYITVGIAWAL